MLNSNLLKNSPDPQRAELHIRNAIPRILNFIWQKFQDVWQDLAIFLVTVLPGIHSSYNASKRYVEQIAATRKYYCPGELLYFATSSITRRCKI